MLSSVSVHASYHTVLPCGVEFGMRCLRRRADAFEAEFRTTANHLLKHVGNGLYGEDTPSRGGRRGCGVL